MDSKKLEQAGDLVAMADRAAKILGKRHSVIVTPDGTLGVHSDAFIAQRGLEACEVLYVAEGR